MKRGRKSIASHDSVCRDHGGVRSSVNTVQPTVQSVVLVAHHITLTLM